MSERDGWRGTDDGYGVGIDLGTTRTAAAIWHQGRATVLPLTPGDEGPSGRGCPSAVHLDPGLGVRIGAEAERAAVDRPEGIARGFKRRFGDEVPYLLAGHEVTAEQLTGHLLAWVLTGVVRAQGNVPPSHVALTVPATWQGYRLRCMERVVRDVGLDCDVTLLPEPAAAAIFYAGRDQVAPGTTVGVYDFGGGTFDATVLRKTVGGFEILGEPLGLDTVGGVDVDDALLRLVALRLGDSWTGLDRSDPRTRQDLALLGRAVVDAKEELSAQPQVNLKVHLPGITRRVTVSRTALEEVVWPLVEQTVDLMDEVVGQAGLDRGQLDQVLLVGGSSRMPLVERLITERLGVHAVRDAHPKYAVCLGAAVAAGSLLTGPSVLPAPAPGTQPLSLPTTAPWPEAVGGSTSGPPAGAADGLTELEVDLARYGLDDAGRVPVRPASELRRWRPAATVNEQLSASLVTDEAYHRAAQRAVLLAVVLVALLAVVAVLIHGMA